MTDFMHSFDLYAPASVEEAAELLDKHGKDAWVVAGGKDSFDWFKDRIKKPQAVIDISGLKQLHGIKDRGDHVSIGAVTTLTEIEESKLLKDNFPILVEAAGKVASPQIRNAGTLGGNVSQDTRCAYYRDGFPCYRAGGNTCYANTPTAMNREHALYDATRCVAVTPSDTGPALVALEAEMVISRKGKLRTVAAEKFFIGPATDITRMTVLDKGDILTEIRIPKKWAGAKYYFEKVADRQTWDFALVNIAMVAKTSGGKVTDARMACGGVQCTPRRLTSVESLMKGEAVGTEMETLAKRVAAQGAKALNYNHFKIPLMGNLAARAVRSLA
ncbi:MAG: xanthine dehydrogenase family protein subunit M [Rhodospirillaceae bacterium]|jgi:xanthine dehydrogenase YagS FAD-binding subunit|nr:xanthine dehydrogenase family protein subunit M [Rhodospirillaceae bacterium]MBT5458665.1 xanthine dehydrogenase family protein subunit M [Rhodospirillaceae bacterium]